MTAAGLRAHKPLEPHFAAIPSLPRTSSHKGTELRSGAATEITPRVCHNNSARAHGGGEAISPVTAHGADKAPAPRPSRAASRGRPMG